MNGPMYRKLLITGIAGAGVGMILLTGLHGILPVFAHLPGGGRRCTECHELHGGVRFDDLRTDGWIHLTGDVPAPLWIETARLFQSHQIDGLPGVSLRVMLTEHGCSEFRRVVLISADGGHVSIDSEDLTESTRLVPHLNAARLADDRLHSSAWLRAVVEVCVVAREPLIELNGRQTTFGTLLAGARTTVLTDPAHVARRDESTGRLYRSVTSHLMTGIDLSRLIEPPHSRVIVTANGQRLSFDAQEVRNAVISRDKHEGHLVLVLPRRTRDEWPVNVTAVESVP